MKRLYLFFLAISFALTGIGQNYDSASDEARTVHEKNSLKSLVIQTHSIDEINLQSAEILDTVAIFNYVGSVQNFIVPAGVHKVKIVAYGAQGGASEVCGSIIEDDGGLGGFAQGFLDVTSGDILQVFVGGKPSNPAIGQSAIPGGFNGGGDAGRYGGAGGGASDVRIDAGTLSDRVIVAAGGGGGNTGCPNHGTGGAGGGLIGSDGIGLSSYPPGGGGTQTDGGAGANAGPAGSFGFGGSTTSYHYAGGGGGWYGGGSAYAAGAGGGSSYIEGVYDSYTISGIQSGDGMVRISWEFVCMEEIVQACDEGECTAVVTYEKPESWEGATVTQIDASGLTSGDVFPIGTTVQSYELVWDGGEILPPPPALVEKSAIADITTDTCTFTVTVMDTIAPEAKCKDIGITLDTEGKARIYPGFIDNGSSDDCGSLSYSLDKTKFYCHDIGENTVVMSVKDASGNVSTCSSTVTIADNWLPEVACNDIEVILGAEGFAVIDSSMIDAGSTAICGIEGIELSQTVFTSADLGENSITMTVSNLSGITATCESKVTVKDEIAPVANCNSITVWLTDSASYELSEADLVAISSGSSDNASVSDSLQVEVSPSVFDCSQVGDSVQVEVTVTDEAGNESTCEAMVYVKDSSELLLSSVDDIEISLPAGVCETTITYPEVFSSKVCASITQIAGLGAEGIFPAGTTVESWEVSYGEEKDTISFAVIVRAENAVPTIDSLADVSVNEDEGPVVIALSGISSGVDCVEQTLSITAENSSSELVTGIEVVYIEGDTTGTVSLTLGANQSGTDSISVVVEDSEGAQTEVSFVVTVNPVNDAPYLVTPLPDAIVNASYSFELGLSAMLGVVFDDVDDDVLEFDVMLEGTDSLPSWAAIEAGVLTATPMIADTGSYSFVVTATDTSGAMASDTFVLEVDGYPTSIGDIAAGSFELNLYPNPTKGLVTLELQERSATDIEIKVMNVSGAEVFRKNFGANDKIQFDLSEQVSGMYMVLIEADGQRVVKKLILDKK
ncbi:glycine-rich protein [uncultured Draconibacterium sp.]|uniref:glycine-rich protein n=1 Tax=uncultured Draconibacterium sp. TaxID=1573823 RepID=UPI003216AC8E